MGTRRRRSSQLAAHSRWHPGSMSNKLSMSSSRAIKTPSDWVSIRPIKEWKRWESLNCCSGLPFRSMSAHCNTMTSISVRPCLRAAFVRRYGCRPRTAFHLPYLSDGASAAFIKELMRRSAQFVLHGERFDFDTQSGGCRAGGNGLYRGITEPETTGRGGWVPSRPHK
jgi:hypothetical protein